MRRAALDPIWFALAAVLLAVGVIGWWAIPDAYAYDAGDGRMIALWLSTGIILLAWWRRAAAPTAFETPLLGRLALAASAPLSLLPLVDEPSRSSLVALMVAGLAVAPLAWSLVDRLQDPDARRRGRLVLLASAALALLWGWQLGMGVDANPLLTLRWAAVAVTVLLPASLVAWALLLGPEPRPIAAQQRVVQSLTILAIGIAPAVTALCMLFPLWQFLVLPAMAAGATALLLGRFAVQPLARLASSATVQRDRVVVAMDSERTRLASVLHDGPLADITLLIQRLDERGDVDSAAIARSIATELRAVGSELSLPILDDLGTGPALEWLAARLGQRAGTSVSVEHQTTDRPPASVELAAYRVAQEALVNALKYGASPIHVVYQATPGRVLLSVDDSGPGIDRDAPMRAEREGRLGISSMAQRAEAIGARLVLAARASGGTHVGLEWQRTDALV